jgi:hypothetical protein
MEVSMPRNTTSAVIDSVHYLPDGRIDFVRLYERRGVVWSDLILAGRNELVKRIRKGKIATGSRKRYLGSDIIQGTLVQYEMDVFFTGNQRGKIDSLPGVPVL